MHRLAQPSIILLCLASSCILLHHIASSCIALHRLASSCIVLHYLASSCIVLQRLASSCSVLHHLALPRILLHHLAASCIVLHYLASSCIVLHHLASFCIILRTETPINTTNVNSFFVWKLPHKWPKKAQYHDAMNDTCYFIFVWIIPHKQSTKHRYHDAVFFLHPTSVEVAKTSINELRSSATGSQFRLECVCTPPAVARTRSSSFRISYKARLSHSLPCETAPRRSSSNFAADASSTYSIRHTATTKQQ